MCLFTLPTYVTTNFRGCLKYRVVTPLLGHSLQEYKHKGVQTCAFVLLLQQAVSSQTSSIVNSKVQRLFVKLIVKKLVKKFLCFRCFLNPYQDERWRIRRSDCIYCHGHHKGNSEKYRLSTVWPLNKERYQYYFICRKFHFKASELG